MNPIAEYEMIVSSPWIRIAAALQSSSTIATTALIAYNKFFYLPCDPFSLSPHLQLRLNYAITRGWAVSHKGLSSAFSPSTGTSVRGSLDQEGARATLEIYGEQNPTSGITRFLPISQLLFHHTGGNTAPSNQAIRQSGNQIVTTPASLRKDSWDGA
ncbi:hypothetical protein CPB86DRAFT_796169 [Serendipita vermifera]|nr:hypothetical protein CPB86DRAFT_796169 [Serendipita vermifera]